MVRIFGTYVIIHNIGNWLKKLKFIEVHVIQLNNKLPFFFLTFLHFMNPTQFILSFYIGLINSLANMVILC